MKKCTVKNCHNKHYGKGYCRRHYDQYRKHGKILKRTVFDKNEISIVNDICRMKLYNQKQKLIGVAKFDKCDLLEIEKHKWYLTKCGYVATRIKRKHFYLHRFILKPHYRKLVDHINHNPLDNRRVNLRLVNYTQSVWNTRNKGYSFHKASKMWVAEIMVNYRRIYLGCFKKEGEAKKARKKAEKKYFGKYSPS